MLLDVVDVGTEDAETFAVMSGNFGSWLIGIAVVEDVEQEEEVVEGTNDGNIAGDDAFGGAGGQINREIGAVAICEEMDAAPLFVDGNGKSGGSGGGGGKPEHAAGGGGGIRWKYDDKGGIPPPPPPIAFNSICG